MQALVRQESAYNSLAVSFADARGLTQMITPTGALIVSSQGVPWELDGLFNAKTSLRFGAHYLGSQLERFDSNVFAARSAYTGAPV
jgi:soluble lytic murein transglycosylase